MVNIKVVFRVERTGEKKVWQKSGGKDQKSCSREKLYDFVVERLIKRLNNDCNKLKNNTDRLSKCSASEADLGEMAIKTPLGNQATLQEHLASR